MRLFLFVKENFMKATIMHESPGRMHLRLKQKRMTLAQADLLEAWLQKNIGYYKQLFMNVPAV